MELKTNYKEIYDSLHGIIKKLEIYLEIGNI